MSKAILVIEKPDKCSNCKFMVSRYAGDYCIATGSVRTLRLKDVCDEHRRKPDFCPLKPLPGKMHTDELPFADSFEEGWNTCIDEILKGGDSGNENT